jgi:Mor family transcriptional regulator
MRRLNNNQNEQSKRNREIFEKREGGSMIIELSQEYGLSIPRIHRICVQEEVKDLRDKIVVLENKNSSCENILRHKGK